MALSVSGYLPLTVWAMEVVYQESKASLNYASRSTEELKSQLEKIRDQIKIVVEKMLSHFKVQGSTIEEKEAALGEAIRELQETTKSLNGIDYQHAFGRYIRAAEPFSEKEQTIQTKYSNVLKALELIVQESVEDTSVEKELYKILQPQIEEDLMSLHSGEKDYRYNKNRYYSYKMTPYFAELTKLMRSRFRRALANGQFDAVLSKLETKDQSITFEVTETNLWDYIRLKPEEAKNVFAAHSGMRDKALEMIKQTIVSKTRAHRKDLLEQAIDKVIYSSTEQDKTDYAINAVMVGARQGGMLGILGEIQALYYVLCLVKQSNKNDALWAGGIKQQGQDPHSDVLMKLAKDYFGVQVKNVSHAQYNEDGSEIFNIDFKKFQATEKYTQNEAGVWESFFTEDAVQAASELGIPSDVMQAVYQLVAMRAFNVPYIWHSDGPEDSQAEQVPLDAIPINTPGGQAYYSTRTELMSDMITDLLGRVMIQYVVGLLYLQTGLDEVTPDKPQSNALFIIDGGKKVITAYRIVNELLKQLDATITRLSFRAEYTKPKEGIPGTGTIVDVINSPAGTGFTGKFALTTSFDFGGLF